MAELLRQRWESDLGAGLSRRDRLGCDYDAYLPDRLGSRKWRLDAATAADVAEAEVAISRLDREASALRGTEVLARILLRAESVASSRIEGLEVGGRRLLRAEAARGFGEPATDVTAAEVLANIDAMVRATELVGVGDPITVASLLDVHRRLLAASRLEQHGGRLRTEQNWIGGSGYNPCSAAFVPPPPEAVPDLLEDLCAFCADDALPAVAQAAIAHAQFETIHPFVDGNGRTGRALIHMVLRRRGLAAGVLPPVSLILATWSREYLAALAATHYLGPATSDEAQQATDSWVALFAAACTRACADAVDFEQRVETLRDNWLRRAGPVRADSTLERILHLLPAAPVLTVGSAAALSGRSLQATNQAINRLVDVGVLRQITVGRRNRAFEAPEAIEAFVYLERRLASPAGDTIVSPPNRRVPRRP
ncbi:cell filamentation protein Fic [Frankia sp. CcI49]|uniref:Fic family protein n=1 Tax=unclassified Frankia TaxID=2632575 RepID=UPI0006CA254C|nr:MULTISPECIES: Fic family protein [unclassified Frankia]KPM53735.1 cell filamentation protein Fic [Frankia sp. R43]ONH60648.1 cell filamentation protein Fic [Frankia sp. CcI49]